MVKSWVQLSVGLLVCVS